MDQNRRIDSASLTAHVKNKYRTRTWKRVVSGLSAVAVFVTTYALILPALTLEAALACGLEQHTHDDSCYSEIRTLICGLEETPVSEGHTHTDACYESVLTCPLPEGEGHVHGESCFDEEGNLTLFGRPKK